MKKATMNGVTLEYDDIGSGEPALLISTGPIADSFFPLLSESALADRYRLITYRQRGQGGSTHSCSPVTFQQHAADAVALLCHLDIQRAHVAGHSTGAAITLQLAHDYPESVQTLALLEPPLMSVPSAGAFFEAVGPALEAYGSGDREDAMKKFLSMVCSIDWETCESVLDEQIPDGVALAMTDAETFFGGYLPALNAWQFGPEEAATISQPVLSVLGTRSEQLFVDGHALLHAWFPDVEDCTIEGVPHLLHFHRPEPVAKGLAAFFDRHAMANN